MTTRREWLQQALAGTVAFTAAPAWFLQSLPPRRAPYQLERLGRDPTQTTRLRAEFERAHVVRLERIQAVVSTSVIGNDAFNLTRRRPLIFGRGGHYPADVIPIAEGSPSPRTLQLRPSFTFRRLNPAFDFGRGSPARKAEAFQRWLGEMLDQGLLEVGDVTEIATAAWQREFVQRGYLTGIKSADAKLRAAGLRMGTRRTNLASILRRPQHREALELLFLNAREDLVGIRRFVLTAGSRAARQGLRAGVGQEELAREINRAVGVGIKRSRILARTSIVEAHADATLNRFAEAGVEEVEGIAEFATAGDDRVCPQCAGLEGEVFAIEDARGLIPLHGGCRCSWVLPEGVSLEAAA